MKDAAINCFSDILKMIKNIAVHERHMISEVMIICNLLQVNPATSATQRKVILNGKKSENIQYGCEQTT